jgi:hypothetical protein
MGAFLAFAARVGSKYPRRNAILPSTARKKRKFSTAPTNQAANCTTSARPDTRARCPRAGANGSSHTTSVASIVCQRALSATSAPSAYGFGDFLRSNCGILLIVLFPEGIDRQEHLSCGKGRLHVFLRRPK